MNQEMVKALLDGRKTQARRPVKSNAHDFHDLSAFLHESSGRLTWAPGCGSVLSESSPFGKPGDELYVREKTRVESHEVLFLPELVNSMFITYLADDKFSRVDRPDRIKYVRAGSCMPNGCFREAARIHLLVKRVWVERLTSISLDDMYADGAPAYLLNNARSDYCDRYFSAKSWFFGVWNSIYKKRGYGIDVNPYVWCCEFERIEK
jgi:hypothetical protein